MRLFVQIPCYNEEYTLPGVLEEIPSNIDGIDAVETLVLDDGSDDRTAQVAVDYGAGHVIRFPKNQGLAGTFFAGLRYCLDNDADIIVNTDGDGQYPGDAIQNLVEPIVGGRADIAIGARTLPEGYYDAAKQRLHSIGSTLLNLSFDTRAADPPSGFRAYSRDAAGMLIQNAGFSYTMDTLIQSGRSDLRVVNVPTITRPLARPSRLAGSTSTYILRSAVDILRAAKGSAVNGN